MHYNCRESIKRLVALRRGDEMPSLAAGAAFAMSGVEVSRNFRRKRGPALPARSRRSKYISHGAR